MPARTALALSIRAHDTKTRGDPLLYVNFLS
jgi:hypothetical protein